jgi:glutamyl/glutaminyl-tRNA synthetase
MSSSSEASPHTEVNRQYRGRLAPSPTGFLHAGHARTFWTAQARAEANAGILVMRNENLDAARCRAEFVSAMFEDLHWFGLRWQEGPDCGGPFAPYSQSERLPFYEAAWLRLVETRCVYPCRCSRADVQRAARAPHAEDDEPIYPGTCRARVEEMKTGGKLNSRKLLETTTENGRCPNWRFKVPDGEIISFDDGHCGEQQFVAGRDFGDFVIWRHDNVPAYQLAVVVDDSLMKITEVVRGADLLLSTARQILLYRALGFSTPDFWHCNLLTDDAGKRLAKRHDAMSLRALREQGFTPEQIRAKW